MKTIGGRIGLSPNERDDIMGGRLDGRNRVVDPVTPSDEDIESSLDKMDEEVTGNEVYMAGPSESQMYLQR